MLIKNKYQIQCVELKWQHTASESMMEAYSMKGVMADSAY
jgi:hypothetical protein